MVEFKKQNKRIRIKEDKGCLARYCNGPKTCEEDWCEAEQWCPFHPNYILNREEEV